MFCFFVPPRSCNHHICNKIYMWQRLSSLCVLAANLNLCVCMCVCVCFLSTLCGYWDVSSAWLWGHLAAMAGTACGVLPLCTKRTRALSYCSCHEWVWRGCIHTQTHLDWLTWWIWVSFSARNQFFYCSFVLQSAELLASLSVLVDIFNRLCLPSLDCFSAASSHSCVQNPCSSRASKWRDVIFLCFWVGVV